MPKHPGAKEFLAALDRAGEPDADRVVDAFLDSLRHEGDPDADAAVAEFHELRPDVGPRHLVHAMAGLAELGEADRTPKLQDYFGDPPPLPLWADRTLICEAEDFFYEQGPWIGTSLLFASLPSAYGAARGAHVLLNTGELLHGPTRRVGETARLLLEIHDEKALFEGGRGYRAVRGVRLFHAGVRWMLEHDPNVVHTCEEGMPPPPRWCAEWGRPVNQEDLLGTLTTFTTAVFVALDRLGVRYDAREADAYVHSWNVVAFLLGIRDDLLPLDRSRLAAVAAAVERRQVRPSDGGRALTHALVGMVRRGLPAPLRAMPSALIRGLLGDAYADTLGLGRPAGLPGLLALPAVRALALLTTGPIGPLAPLRQRVVGDLFRRHLEHQIRLHHDSDRQFRIPERFATKWGVRTS